MIAGARGFLLAADEVLQPETLQAGFLPAFAQCGGLRFLANFHGPGRHLDAEARVLEKQQLPAGFLPVKDEGSDFLQRCHAQFVPSVVISHLEGTPRTLLWAGRKRCGSSMKSALAVLGAEVDRLSLVYGTGVVCRVAGEGAAADSLSRVIRFRFHRSPFTKRPMTGRRAPGY